MCNLEGLRRYYYSNMEFVKEETNMNIWPAVMRLYAQVVVSGEAHSM